MQTAKVWRRSVKTWDGTEIQIIVGPDDEEILQEPTEFSAYASGAFVTPAGKEANLQLASTAPELLAACELALAAAYDTENSWAAVMQKAVFKAKLG